MKYLVYTADKVTIECLQYWSNNVEVIDRNKMKFHDVVLFDMMLNKQMQFGAN
jgi:hypothetical protein